MDTAVVNSSATGGLDVLFITTVGAMLLFVCLFWWLIGDKSRPDHQLGGVAESTTPAATKRERET